MGNQISRKLIKYVSFAYFTIAIICTTVHIYLEFHHEMEQVKTEVISIENSFDSIISRALWDINPETLKAGVESILKNKLISKVVIYDEDKKELINILNTKKEFIPGDFDVYKYEISHIEDAQSSIVGYGELYYDKEVVSKRVFYTLIIILTNAIIKTVFLWTIIYFIAEKIISKPLTYLNKEVDNMMLSANDSFENSELNELDNLLKSFEKMREIIEDKTAKLEDKNIKLTNEVIESSDNFNNIYSANYEAISTLENDKFLDCNDALLTLLKIKDKNTFIKSNPLDFSPKMQPLGVSSKEKSQQMIKQAFKNGYNRFEWLHKKSSGELFPAEICLTKISHKGKDILYCVWKDLTKDKALLKHLEEEKAKANKANHAKSEFLSNMSHELKTPMNSIIGFSELLKNENLQPEQLESVDFIYNAGQSLLKMINEILDLAKIEAGKMKIETLPFCLEDSVNTIIYQHSLTFKKLNLDFDYSIDKNIPDALEGDPYRLLQILNNFISNAIKFTSDGNVKLNISLIEKNEYIAKVKFEIVDTGIGIESDKLTQIFKPFTQADGSTTRNYGGTGLGLTICSKIIDLMDGELGVESEVGKGSAFWVIIPFKIIEDMQEGQV